MDRPMVFVFGWLLGVSTFWFFYLGYEHIKEKKRIRNMNRSPWYHDVRKKDDNS